MLAMWPGVLFLAPFAALFIRVALAALFALAALRRSRSHSGTLRIFAIADILIAIALFIGFRVQLVALFVMICLTAWLLKKEWRAYPKSTCALGLVMAMTLIITGAGPLAYDWPL